VKNGGIAASMRAPGGAIVAWCNKGEYFNNFLLGVKLVLMECGK